jgi:hypothetical protein
LSGLAVGTAAGRGVGDLATDGLALAVGVRVAVEVTVGVAVGAIEGVIVGRGVSVAVGVSVARGVSVGVFVAVEVGGSAVGVAVGGAGLGAEDAVGWGEIASARAGTIAAGVARAGRIPGVFVGVGVAAGFGMHPPSSAAQANITAKPLTAARRKALRRASSCVRICVLSANDRVRPMIDRQTARSV